MMLATLTVMCLCAGASAQRIYSTLEPDISDAPWCAGIVFDLDLEEPADFPSPIPCYQTKYADVSVEKLRALLAERGLPKPAHEAWYNGRDDVNRRNFVFREVDARYVLFSSSLGLPLWTTDAQKQAQARAAVDICRAFLEDAGLTGIEEPYFAVKRTADRPVYLNSSPEFDEICGIDGNRFTGIGFRYTLGGLPVAVTALYDPAYPDRNEHYFCSMGQMTVRDDGVITSFELSNYREIERELAPYDGPVIPWRQAVDAVLDEVIHRTSHDEDGLPEHTIEHDRRISVRLVEPALALTPDGRSFPVWTVVLECEHESTDWGIYPIIRTAYVNAVTGEFAEPVN